LRRIPSNAATLVDLEISHAEVVATIEIVGTGNASLLGGLDEALEDFPAQPLRFHAPFAAGPVELVRATVMVLAAFEERQHVVPAPAVIASDACPVVVVLALATHVDHAVDRR